LGREGGWVCGGDCREEQHEVESVPGTHTDSVAVWLGF
jgi:hypothetical protein